MLNDISHLIIVSVYPLNYTYIGGQSCVQDVNVQQTGTDEMSHKRLGIVPRLNFHCNARITRIRVRLLPDKSRYDYPYIQVWRPTSKYSKTYTKIAQYKVPESRITELNYVEADIPFTGNNRILVKAGDVIGYYHPLHAGYKVRTIRTTGFVLYEFDDIDGSTATSVDLNDKVYHLPLRQPLIQFTIGKC